MELGEDGGDDVVRQPFQCVGVCEADRFDAEGAKVEFEQVREDFFDFQTRHAQAFAARRQCHDEVRQLAGEVASLQRGEKEGWRTIEGLMDVGRRGGRRGESSRALIDAGSEGSKRLLEIAQSIGHGNLVGGAGGLAGDWRLAGRGGAAAGTRPRVLCWARRRGGGLTVALELTR